MLTLSCDMKVVPQLYVKVQRLSIRVQLATVEHPILHFCESPGPDPNPVGSGIFLLDLDHEFFVSDPDSEEMNSADK